jgi:5-methylcytosine-specific restriction endonuclease McrA
MGKCVFCQKETANPKYCSNQCQGDHAWQTKVDFFEKNGYWENINNPITIQAAYRKYYLLTKHHICAICGNTKWMGQEIPLILDHIDGKGTNYSPENLRLICGNCDMQLPTHKNKNKGKGRGYRRERYKNNQTY